MKFVRSLALFAALLWPAEALATINFPASLDTNTTLHNLSTGDTYIAAFHNDPKDAILALEAKVGVDSSAVTTSLDYLVKNTGSVDPGHKHTGTSVSFVDGSAASPGLRFGSPVTDTNTGLFHPGVGVVSVSTGGTEVVRVTSTGVAILDASGADFPLDVAGTVRIQGSSSLCFGGTGAGDNDTCLARTAAHVITQQGSVIYKDQATTDSTVVLQGIAAKTGHFLSAFLLPADANPSFRLAADGVTLGWGAGGASAIDTTLARSGANALTTSGALTVGGGLNANGTITIADATNIVVNTTTGTKIGTATSQKLGFFNATPVVQPTASTALVTALQNLGFIASGTFSGDVTTTGNVSAADVTASARVVYSTVGSLALANGANNNVALGTTATYYRITGPTGAFSISGLANGAAGRMIVLRSTVSQTLTITNLATSTAANQIDTLTGADIVCTAAEQAAVTLIYDGTQSRWVVVAVMNCATV